MLPKKIAFVDIEITGTSSSRGRIIEIGIVKIENNKIIQNIPPEITVLTGIISEDLINAPTF